MGHLILFLRRVLLPFSWIYGFITDWRNSLYDRGMSPSATFGIPIVSVGNLTVGGTGKTPHLEYLIRLLKPFASMATLSRGYGRDTKGFRIATNQDTAATLGDEPLQVYQKFGKEIRVTVGEKRAEAAEKLLKLHPETDLILLDDAYQHRAIQPQINLLLTDFYHLFYQDYSFPAGNLRERRHGAARADAIIVTKCPENLDAEGQKKIIKKIAKYSKAPVFFSGIRYATPRNSQQQTPPAAPAVLVSGLARPELLETYAQSKYKLAQHLAFGDHHAYTAGDWQKVETQLRQTGSPEAWVLTTEKDYVKLKSVSNSSTAIYVLPIEVYFLKSNPLHFDDWLLQTLGFDVKKA
ncbi:tetraacyldisaccharide 4'-kinase [Siphonobacter sp. SORGH_AS_1065]|uniref:tetraacyldisaccharide 4'-kinase n=1 Tax=Siphonobacter sp. SORGH_AS_1065 TaxID=3041795 RepID=UPI002786ED9A|nr:tetraacyldisaccharide 4'-kinase [Siphonobacter sp. SORGH_AS_1065]MDQ1089155.1 tetraacyldisaccharide 4'-kinase [Siphonobacter sp. SORGH_AS_1065]